MSYRYLATLLIVSMISGTSYATVSITDEVDGASYNLVSTHRVDISATRAAVWKNLKNLKSWMYDFELSHHSGPEGEVGEVLRLYPGQDFFVQITSMTPTESMVFSNLPSSFRGEYSTGSAVIVLGAENGKTVVSLVMSRRYTWVAEGENPMKAQRSSQEFVDQTNATWSRFLERLRELSEGA